jgi:hypothetical protein
MLELYREMTAIAFASIRRFLQGVGTWGGFSIWHWIILLAVVLIPVGIAAVIAAIVLRRK